MLHIVLFEPEIPENTGNIIRTCVGFNAQLHLIRPYGFFLNDKRLKRSSVTYMHELKIHEYDCFDDFLKLNNIQPNDKRIYLITRYGLKTSKNIDFKTKSDIYLMFGKESTGIRKEILKEFKEQTIRIPSSNKVRSLNLANCVAMLTYQYALNNDFLGLDLSEPFKKNYLD